MHGALLINKPEGISSFGVVERLQRVLRERGMPRKAQPKIGHGGTLDPFATGLLVVCVGRAVKLARYFLGSDKCYEGVIRFGETTVPGDPTAPISERSEKLPDSKSALQTLADSLTRQPYLQTPPMFSAKKKDGKPLYELARRGIEVEREPKICHLRRFQIGTYESPRASFELRCTSGTYVRTLAQDFGRLQGSVAMLESLHRTASGSFHVKNAWTLEQIEEASRAASGVTWPSWDEFDCWRRFDDLLVDYDRANATRDEAVALMQGRSNVLFNILKRAEPGASSSAGPDENGERDEAPLAIYCDHQLVAIARRTQGVWGLERVFTRG